MVATRHTRAPALAATPAPPPPPPSSPAIVGGPSPPPPPAIPATPATPTPAPGPSTLIAFSPSSPLPQTQLLELPVEVLANIFRCLKYKKVAQLRIVCRQLNNVCGSYLNSSFQRLVSQTLNEFQTIKSKMPRRESARRNHTLACEFDVIETVHMRLSLLQMTFGKHIERKYCCFFPGEILDEVDSILEYLKVTTKLARPFKLTDELFDLSTMAMEFFKEHMEPNLPEITYFGTEFFDLTGTFSPGDGNKSYLCMDSPPPPGSNEAGGSGGDTSGALMLYEEEYLPPSPPPPQSNMVLRKRIHRIKQGMKRYNNQLTALRSELRSCKRKAAWQQKQIAEQQRLFADQQKQTLEYSSRLDEHDKKNEETSRKFQTLLQELNKCRTELQYWRSKSPATTPSTICSECGDPMVPNLMPQFTLDQYLADAEFVDGFRRPPTNSEPPRPVSPQQLAAAPASASVPVMPVVSTEINQLVENPMSPKASVSSSKTPDSPKARRTTSGDSKSSSSDEGCSKRTLAETNFPQEHKKRRLQRTVKPRKQ